MNKRRGEPLRTSSGNLKSADSSSKGDGRFEFESQRTRKCFRPTIHHLPLLEAGGGRRTSHLRRSFGRTSGARERCLRGRPRPTPKIPAAIKWRRVTHLGEDAGSRSVRATCQNVGRVKVAPVDQGAGSKAWVVGTRAAGPRQQGANDGALGLSLNQRPGGTGPTVKNRGL
jgi:hypothetical protein